MERAKRVSTRTHGARREAVGATLATRVMSIGRVRPYARLSLCARRAVPEAGTAAIGNNIHHIRPENGRIPSDEKGASRIGSTLES
jgi:hypothetical protein